MAALRSVDDTLTATYLAPARISRDDRCRIQSYPMKQNAYLPCLLLIIAVGCSDQTMIEEHSEENPVQLNPEFPVVEGRYQMTKEWSVDLPTKFNRRMEDGSLVIWKPGFTIWTTVWGNDNAEPAQKRMTSLKSDSSPDAFDLTTESTVGLLRYSYRLTEEADDDRNAAFYCFAVGKSGHVQMAIYFDVADDIEEAQFIWRSIIESQNKG